jgi:hypothetical protein
MPNTFRNRIEQAMTTNTLTPRNRSRKPACGRALTDHQFVGCIDRTAATETWESRSADGRRWQVKVLFNVAGTDPKRAEAVRRLQSLSHPNLVASRILPGGPGCLVVASEFAAVTLFDHLKQFQLDGALGIPRQQLLAWLRIAAVALEEVAKEYGVSHLALSPRHLLPTDDTLLISEYGLAQLMWLPTGQFQGQIQPRYAAPELPAHLSSGPACDQFSLAAVYQELLTGSPPFRSRPVGAPDLTALEEADRAVVARALNLDPKKRFPSSLDFLSALENVGKPKAIAPAPVKEPAPITEILSEKPAAARDETPRESIVTQSMPRPEPALQEPAVNTLIASAPVTVVAEEPAAAAVDPVVEQAAVDPEPVPEIAAPIGSEPEVTAASVADILAEQVDEAKTYSLGTHRTGTHHNVSLPGIETPAPAVAPVAELAALEAPPVPALSTTDAWISLDLPQDALPAETPPRADVGVDSPALSEPSVEACTPAAANDDHWDDPAPPVNPTRLLNEGHQATATIVEPREPAPVRSSPFDQDGDDLASCTVPFDQIFPLLNDSVGSLSDFPFPNDRSATPAPVEGTLTANERDPPETSERSDEESIPGSASPFDPGFAPSSNNGDAPSDWSFPVPSRNGAMDRGASEESAVAVVDNRPDASPGFAPEPAAEAPPAPPDEPYFEPFNMPLRTSKLMPAPDGELPVEEAAKTEAAKPVFRTLRSLKRDTDSQKHRTVAPINRSAQTVQRMAADLKALLAAATQAVPPNEPERWLTTEEEGEVLECRFPASLPPTGPPINFERFRDKWNGQLLSNDEDAALFEVGANKRFWKRLLGAPTPLFVEVRWSRPRPPAIGIPGVIMRVRLANKDDKKASSTLHDIGPKLVESLRSQLQGASDRRREKRTLWVQPVSASFLLSNGEKSGTVEGQSRDLTETGMGLYLPRILPGTQVSLLLNDPAASPVTVLGKFVRVQRCGDGWYEVGVRFELG